MRGFELKRSVDKLLNKSTDANETTPINLAKNKSVDHGTIKMNRTLSADDIYQSPCGKKLDSDPEILKNEVKPEKMTLLRKLCFVLSFNGGILYLVAFAWLIPCRLYPCLLSEDKWITNLTNLKLTSNLETNSLVNPTLVIFGHSDKNEGNLKSLKISDGSEAWNSTLFYNPLKIYCNLQNKNKICFVVGKNNLEAFHAENGSRIWNQTIISDHSISELFILQEKRNGTYLAGISGEYLYIFDIVDGKKIAKSLTPCLSNANVKITGPWITHEGYTWGSVCQYNDGIEVFMFGEKDLLQFNRRESEDIIILDINFKSLIRKQSHDGSIDLACDVTTTQDSLLLSWADMVVMATAQAPFQLFNETWERSFSSSLGYSVDVTSITTGYFADSKSMQIAVAVHDGLNSTIHILEKINGSSIAKSELSSKSIVTIKKLVGADGEKDALLIESIENADSYETQAKLKSRSFHILEFEDNKSVLRLIATTNKYLASSLSLISKGSSNFLLATSDQNENVLLDRYIIQHKDPKKSWCKDEKDANTSIVMFNLE